MIWDNRPGRAYSRLRDLPYELCVDAFIVAFGILHATPRENHPHEGFVEGSGELCWRRMIKPGVDTSDPDGEDNVELDPWNYLLVYRRATEAERAMSDCSDSDLTTLVVEDIFHISELTGRLATDVQIR